MKIGLLVLGVTLSVWLNAQQGLYNGMLVKSTQSDSIFLLLDETKCHVASPTIFEQLFRPGAAVSTLPSLTLNAIRSGTPLNEVYLAKAKRKPPVYLVVNNTKRHLSDASTFERFRFDWGKIKEVKRKHLKRMPDGAPVKANSFVIIIPEKIEEPLPCGNMD